MRDRGESYRLTLDDERRAVDIMRTIAGDWTRSDAPRAASDVQVLQRCGAHSFGCSLYDLREIEVLWLRAKASEILEVTR